MYTTGTATGHNDLLIRLHDWLVNTVGWTEIAYSGDGSPLTNDDIITWVLRAPGAQSGHEYFLSARSAFDVGNAYYGLAFRAMADYDSDQSDMGAQLLASPEIWFNLWQNSIDYWFYATGRRVIVVAKVNTSYVSMYAGLFLPFALPSEYTKPFYIGANYNALASYDLASSRNRFIADPGQGAAFYLNRALTSWIGVSNHAGGSSDVNFDPDSPAIVWPHRSYISPTDSRPGQDWNTRGLNSLRPSANGDSPQILCHIISQIERDTVGALDGVYSIPGFDRTSEQLLSFGSPASNFRCFQNIFRTTGRDFMAIEEI